MYGLQTRDGSGRVSSSRLRLIGGRRTQFVYRQKYHLGRFPKALVSPKRDEMIRAGRGDALDELIKTTHELQDSLIQATHKAVSIDAGTFRS